MPRGIRTARVRSVRPYAKLKWSPIYGDQVLNVAQSDNNHNYVFNTVIAQSAVAQNGIIPPVSKVRHVKARLTIPTLTEANAFSHIIFAIVYKPQAIQGITLQNLKEHPEWIMGYTTGNSSNTQGSILSISSPLSRNLNSGDAIVAFVSAYNRTGGQNEAFQAFVSYTASMRTN